jgi:hypothetical protein
MNGILNLGPAIEPFRHWYITERYHIRSRLSWMQRCSLTLVIRGADQDESEEELHIRPALTQAGKNPLAISIVLVVLYRSIGFSKGYPVARCDVHRVSVVRCSL